jgi:hypothetical protein
VRLGFWHAPCQVRRPENCLKGESSCGRSADVSADSNIECYAISLALFDALGTTHPRIKMTILENLLRNVSRMVTRLNQEVAALAL